MDDGQGLGVRVPSTKPPPPKGASDSLRKFKTKPLRFDSLFESGNIGVVSRLSDTIYDIRIRPDAGNDNFRLWFYFRVSNVSTNGEVYVLVISNICKSKTSFLNKATPVVKSTSRPNWERIQPSQIYYHQKRPKYCPSAPIKTPINTNTNNNSSENNTPTYEYTPDISGSGYASVTSTSPKYQNQTTSPGTTDPNDVSINSLLQVSAVSFQSKNSVKISSTLDMAKKLVDRTPQETEVGDTGSGDANGSDSTGDSNNDVIILGNPKAFKQSQLQQQSTKPILSIAFIFDKDEEYFFALTYPYSFGMLTKYLTRCAQLKFPYVSQYTIQANEGFYTVKNLDGTIVKHKFKPINLVIVGVPRTGSRVVFIFARVHPGETPGSYTAHGMLERAITIRNELSTKVDTVFIFVPMVNPDGVALGNYRGDHTGADLNRRYKYENVPNTLQNDNRNNPLTSTIVDTNNEYLKYRDSPLWSCSGNDEDEIDSATGLKKRKSTVNSPVLLEQRQNEVIQGLQKVIEDDYKCVNTFPEFFEEKEKKH